MSEIWSCKIGETDRPLPPAADGPMRRAVERAYKEITGEDSAFLFSGWRSELTEPERAAFEDRLPMQPDPTVSKPGPAADLIDHAAGIIAAKKRTAPGDELDRALVMEMRVEIDRLRKHSVTLNTLGWRMAVVLGQVPDGAEAVEGDPEGQLSALLAALAEAQRELRAAMDLLAAAWTERDAARADAERKAPVVETSRAVRAHQRRPLPPGTTKDELLAMVEAYEPIARAWEAALDTYETQEGTDGE